MREQTFKIRCALAMRLLFQNGGGRVVAARGVARQVAKAKGVRI